MVPQWIIEKKRDGGELTDGEIRDFIRAYTDGTLPDYQMAAFAMAVFFRGMTDDETTSLTDAMMRSGDVPDMSDMPLPTADKHSTGGIGDKISLPLAPLAAVMGLDVPMISGRGLGITGGTLDKLESIPGYDTRLSVERFREVVAKVGCSIIGQTATLAPADKKLYSLRDVTGTVPSLPLITASIMSKKLAEGAETLVFDVKCGRAAFAQTRSDAEALAASLQRVGRLLGRKTAALISGMDRPLGRCVGNAREVRESIEVLTGRGPDDVRDLTIDLVALMLTTSGVRADGPKLRKELRRRLADGTAAAKFAEMVVAQGGDASCVEDLSRLPQAEVVRDIAAPASGVIADVDAAKIGRAALLLGAGRRAVTDEIDHAAGFSDMLQAGEKVAAGEPLLKLHASRKTDTAEAERLVRDAYSIRG